MVHYDGLLGGENVLNRLAIPDVTGIEAALRVDVLLSASGKIVDDHNVIPTFYVSIGDVRSDESTRSSNKDFHASPFSQYAPSAFSTFQNVLAIMIRSSQSDQRSI